MELKVVLAIRFQKLDSSLFKGVYECTLFIDLFAYDTVWALYTVSFNSTSENWNCAVLIQLLRVQR